MDIQKIAYEKYKLDWMLRHGYTLSDLINEIGMCMEESGEDLICSFDIWESEGGFSSEIWVCYEEFLDTEYQDEGYMKQLLNWEEYEEYLEDIKR